jgi:NADPH:quinone reductase-like Zn-dependent oxidoreductase
MGRQRMSLLMAKPQGKDLVYIKELLEAGKLAPVIERCYPLRETADAFRYLEEGYAQGKVVITMNQTSHNS